MMKQRVAKGTRGRILRVLTRGREENITNAIDRKSSTYFVHTLRHSIVSYSFGYNLSVSSEMEMRARFRCSDWLS